MQPGDHTLLGLLSLPRSGRCGGGWNIIIISVNRCGKAERGRYQRQQYQPQHHYQEEETAEVQL